MFKDRTDKRIKPVRKMNPFVEEVETRVGETDAVEKTERETEAVECNKGEVENSKRISIDVSIKNGEIEKEPLVGPNPEQLLNYSDSLISRVDNSIIDDSGSKVNSKSDEIVEDLAENDDRFGFQERYCEIRMNKDGVEVFKPKLIQENVLEIMDHYGLEAKYDEMKKRSIILRKLDHSNRDETRHYSQDSLYGYIYNKCIDQGLKGISFEKTVLQAIACEAEKNKFNPAKEWIDYCVVERMVHVIKEEEFPELNKLLDTIHVEEGFPIEKKNKLITKWLVSCVAALFEEDGIESQGVLTLQGKQGIMKTTWFKRLVPNNDWIKLSLLLDPKSKDSITTAICHWIVELGELEGTLKKDMSALKAFMTEGRDEIRAPYAKRAEVFTRRTIFGATVNDDEFLKDTTGNRRFWVIPCKKIVFDETLDLEMLWAEIYHLYYNKLENHYLSQEEIVELETTNKKFEKRSDLSYVLEDIFDWDSSDRKWMSSSEIYEVALSSGCIEIKDTTRRKITKELKNYFNVNKRLLDGIELYEVPNIRD